MQNFAPPGYDPPPLIPYRLRNGVLEARSGIRSLPADDDVSRDAVQRQPLHPCGQGGVGEDRVQRVTRPLRSRDRALEGRHEALTAGSDAGIDRLARPILARAREKLITASADFADRPFF